MSTDDSLVFGLKLRHAVGLGLVVLGTIILLLWADREKRLRDAEEERKRIEAEDYANFLARWENGLIRFGSSDPSYQRDPAPNTYTVTRPTGPPKDVSPVYLIPLWKCLVLGLFE